MSRTLESELAQRLKWSPRQREQFCRESLHAVLSHAMQKVPYYEKRFHQYGLSDRDVRHLKDLTLLPLTSPEDLEAAAESFLTRDVNLQQCVSRAHEKIAGHILRIYLSPEESQVLAAIEQRVSSAHGLSGRHTSLLVLPPEQIPARQTWGKRLRQGSRHFISAYESIQEHLHVLIHGRPDCYGAPLWILRRVAQEIVGGAALGFCPRLVCSWGEPLRPADRDLVRKAFGVEPSEVYKSWEFGVMAYETPEHEGLRVNFDHVHIEILRNGRTTLAGETGEVVVTSLTWRTMPLIRYRIGDLASWKHGPCPSEDPGPTLEAIHGRVEEAVVLPTGDFVSALQIEKCLDQFSNLQEYRVFQAQPRQVEIHLVPGSLYTERTGQLVRERCIELFRNKIGVELRVCKQLPLIESHHRRTVFCKIPPPEA